MKPTSRFMTTDSGTLKGKWAYMLTQSLHLEHAETLPRSEIYYGLEHLATIDGNTTIIHAGYAWNGMSCWSDTPTNLLASCAHDLGYQLGNHPLNPFSRNQVDHWLLDLLNFKSDPHARKCFYAVRACGWAFWNRKAEKELTIVS